MSVVAACGEESLGIMLQGRAGVHLSAKLGGGGVEGGGTLQSPQYAALCIRRITIICAVPKFVRI